MVPPVVLAVGTVPPIVAEPATSCTAPPLFCIGVPRVLFSVISLAFTVFAAGVGPDPISTSAPAMIDPDVNAPDATAPEPIEAEATLTKLGVDDWFEETVTVPVTAVVTKRPKFVYPAVLTRNRCVDAL